MDQLGDILQKTLSKKGLADESVAALVVHTANKWIEEFLPLQTENLSVRLFRDGHLVIESKHSIAAQECKIASEGLLTSLRGHFPDEAIEGILLVRE